MNFYSIADCITVFFTVINSEKRCKYSVMANNARERRPKPRDVVSAELPRIRLCGGVSVLLPHKGAVWAGYAQR
jgi:hypothetical protein